MAKFSTLSPFTAFNEINRDQGSYYKLNWQIDYRGLAVGIEISINPFQNTSFSGRYIAKSCYSSCRLCTT